MIGDIVIKKYKDEGDVRFVHSSENISGTLWKRMKVYGDVYISDSIATDNRYEDVKLIGPFKEKSEANLFKINANNGNPKSQEGFFIRQEIILDTQ